MQIGPNIIDLPYQRGKLLTSDDRNPKRLAIFFQLARGMGFFFFNLGNKSMSHLAETTCHHVSSHTYGWYGCAFLVQMVGGRIPWCQLSCDSFSQEIYLSIFCSCKRTNDQNRQKNPVQPRSDGLILHRSISPSCGHSLGHLLLQGVVLPCWCPTQKEKQVLLKLLNNGFRWPFSAVGCASFTMLFFGK